MSGRSDVRTLGRPDTRASGRLDARTPTVSIFFFFSNFAAAAARARAGRRRLEPGRAVTSRAAPALAAAAAKIAKNERKTNEKEDFRYTSFQTPRYRILFRRPYLYKTSPAMSPTHRGSPFGPLHHCPSEGPAARTLETLEAHGHGNFFRPKIWMSCRFRRAAFGADGATFRRARFVVDVSA